MHEEQVFYFFYKIQTIATPQTSANFNESTSSFSLHEITRNLIACALADHDTITEQRNQVKSQTVLVFRHAVSKFKKLTPSQV